MEIAEIEKLLNCGIFVEGRCDTEKRKALVEEAITTIQDSTSIPFEKSYLGVKNYAAFGDQREDHKYGYGPRHGSIIFSIGTKVSARSDSSKIDKESAVRLLLYVLENPEYDVMKSLKNFEDSRDNFERSRDFIHGLKFPIEFESVAK